MLRLLTLLGCLALLPGQVNGQDVTPGGHPRIPAEPPDSVLVVGGRLVRDALLLLCGAAGQSAVYHDPYYETEDLQSIYPDGPRVPTQRSLSFQCPRQASLFERCKILCEASKTAFGARHAFRATLIGETVFVSPDDRGNEHIFWKGNIGGLSGATTVGDLIAALNQVARQEDAPYVFDFVLPGWRAVANCKIILDSKALRSSIPQEVIAAAQQTGLRGLFWEELGEGTPTRYCLVRVLPRQQERERFLVRIEATRPMMELFAALAGQMRTPIMGFEEPVLPGPDWVLRDGKGRVWGPQGGILEVHARDADAAFLAALRNPEPGAFRYAILPSPTGIICVPTKGGELMATGGNLWKELRSPFDLRIEFDNAESKSSWDWLDFACQYVGHVSKQKVALIRPPPEVLASLERSRVDGFALPNDAREMFTHLLQQCDPKLRWLIQYDPASKEFRLSVFLTNQ